MADIHPACRPPKTITYEPVLTVEITRDLATLLSLQTFDCYPLSLDIGNPTDTSTMIVKFSANGIDYQLTSGMILVKHPEGFFETYPDIASFLLDYQLV
jgi:hypothetical protein